MRSSIRNFIFICVVLFPVLGGVVLVNHLSHDTTQIPQETSSVALNRGDTTNLDKREELSYFDTQNNRPCSQEVYSPEAVVEGKTEDALQSDASSSSQTALEEEKGTERLAQQPHVFPNNQESNQGGNQEDVPELHYPVHWPVHREKEDAHRWNDDVIEEEATDDHSSRHYTLNCNEMDIKEVLRLVSKISGINFIFSESELSFPVTMMSSNETEIDAVIASLIQLLRIHGFATSEEGNSVLIHRGTTPAFSTEVSGVPVETKGNHALITCVIPLGTVLPSQVLPIVSPMLSPYALLQACDSTHHLLITDTEACVSSVQKMLELIDQVEHLCAVDVVPVSYNVPSEVEASVREVMGALSSGVPFWLEAKDEKQCIVIVSTKTLIQQTKDLIHILDLPIDERKVSFMGQAPSLYTPKHCPGEQMVDGMHACAQQLEQSRAKSGFTIALRSTTWIPSMGSLLILGEPKIQERIVQIAATMDQSAQQGDLQNGNTILIYYPEHVTLSELSSDLSEVREALKANGEASSMFRCLERGKILSSGEGILFTGDPAQLRYVQTILSSVDTPTTDVANQKSRCHPFTYSLNHLSPDQLQEAIHELTTSSKEETPLLHLLKTMHVSDHGVLFLYLPNELRDEVKQFLLSVDTEEQKERLGSQYELYESKRAPSSVLLVRLHSLAEALYKSRVLPYAVVQAVKEAKEVKESSSILLVGSRTVLNTIHDMLLHLDSDSNDQLHRSGYWVYRSKYVSPESLMQNLNQVLENLSSSPMGGAMEEIDRRATLLQGGTIVFTGDPETLNALSQVVKMLDQPATEGSARRAESVLSYKPTSKDGEELLSLVKEYEHALEAEGGDDPDLLQTLKQGRWLGKAKVLVFTGPQKTIDQVKEILKTLEEDNEGVGFYIPEHVSSAQLLHSLKDLNLSPDLQRLVNQAKVVQSGKMIRLEGSPAKVDVLKQWLTSLDHQNGRGGADILVYIPQNVSLDQLHHSVDMLMHNLGEDDPLVPILKESTWDRSTQRFIVHGMKLDLDRLRQLLKQVDVISKQGNHVFSYVCQKMDVQRVDAYLQEMEQGATKTESSHPEFLALLKSRKIVGNTLIFMGTQEAWDRLHGLLETYDLHSSSSTGGFSSFAMYRPQHASGEHLKHDLELTTQQLKSSSLADPELIGSLEKVVWNGRSFLITGNEATIAKVRSILEHFDTEDRVQTPQVRSQFFVYTPQHLSGQEMMDWIRETVSQLESSGLEDSAFLESLQSAHWSESNHTITFAGTPETLDRVKVLMQDKDARLKEDKEVASKKNISFLVYKLNHQQGQPILEALQSMGSDLRRHDENKDDANLMNAIASAQWLRSNNSLVFSGDSSTLGRLKATLDTIDRPQRQVFIEILIFQMRMDHSMNLGLRWGASGKFAGCGASLSSGPGEGSTYGSYWNDLMSDTKQGKVGLFNRGLDMGVVGDSISFGAQTFSSLAALARSLEEHKETAIILHPKLIAQDNQQAVVFSGSNRPFEVSKKVSDPSYSGSKGSVTETLDYRNVGMELRVKPMISGADTVTMEIDYTFTEDEREGTRGVENAISKQTIQTQVHVPNGCFVAISGVLRDTRGRKDSAPASSSWLKALGRFASDSGHQQAKENIIVFVRPQIITPTQAAGEITAQQEEQCLAQAGTRNLQQDFVDAINMVAA